MYNQSSTVVMKYEASSSSLPLMGARYARGPGVAHAL